MQLKCKECKNDLYTDDLWINSTVDPHNIVIGCKCWKCDSYRRITVDYDNFKQCKSEDLT
jgi:hypothetical protein